MKKKFMEVAQDFDGVLSPGGLHDVLTAFKIMKEAGGKCSVFISTNGSRIESIEVVTKPAEEMDGKRPVSWRVHLLSVRKRLGVFWQRKAWRAFEAVKRS